jgi:hypothetical protein
VPWARTKPAALVGFEQCHQRRVDLQTVGGSLAQLLDQLAGVAAVDRHAPDLGHVLAVAGPQQGLPDAWVGADAADRGHHVGQALVVQRAERDLDHHLAAVAAARHQVHLRAHRARPRVVRVGAAEGRMFGPDRIGHQRVDRQAVQFTGPVAQQPAGFGVGQHDRAAGIDQQQRVGVGLEQRPVQQRHAVDGAVRSEVGEVGRAHARSRSLRPR